MSSQIYITGYDILVYIPEQDYSVLGITSSPLNFSSGNLQQARDFLFNADLILVYRL